MQVDLEPGVCNRVRIHNILQFLQFVHKSNTDLRYALGHLGNYLDPILLCAARRVRETTGQKDVSSVITLIIFFMLIKCLEKTIQRVC